jgi:hypothetical protein
VKRVILDNCVPRTVRESLPDCEVTTAYRQGWASLKNGQLLTAAETAGFNVFVTSDKNLRYQQNLSSRRIGIIVLPTNTLERLLPIFGLITAAVQRAGPGTYEEISF